MANPLAPGVSVKGKFITNRNVPARPNPKGKQGMTGSSTFPAAGNHESLGGNSESYRVTASPRFMRNTSKHSGFGAVKKPTAGKSPMGVSPQRRKGNFGKV